MVVVASRRLFPFSFQFFTRLAAMFAENVRGLSDLHRLILFIFFADILLMANQGSQPNHQRVLIDFCSIAGRHLLQQAVKRGS